MERAYARFLSGKNAALAGHAGAFRWTALLAAALLAIAGCSGSSSKSKTSSGTTTSVPSGLTFVCITATDAGALTVNGGSVSGNVSSATCVLYTFSASSGTTYTVTLTTTSGNADLEVSADSSFFNLAGFSFESGTSPDSVTFTASSSQTHYIAIEGAQSSSYTLAVTTDSSDGDTTTSSGTPTSVPSGLFGDCDSATSAGSLTVGASATSGTVAAGTCVLYNFSGTAEVEYTVTLKPSSGNPDLVVASDSSFFDVLDDSFNSGTTTDAVTFTASSTQTHYIAVQGSQGSAFTIQVKFATSTGGDSTDGCSSAAATSDSSALEVIQTVPPNASTGVDPESTIIVFFNDNIDFTSLDSESVVITGNPTVIFGCQVSEAGNAILSITASSGFTPSSSITISLPAGGVLDDEGNSLASQFSFSFTTSAASASASGTGLDFEGGSLPTGVTCTGDCGLLGSFGDAPPVGSYGAYISTGSNIVSSGSAVDDTTSVLTISNVTPGVTTLTFTYNFISEEFDEWVGSQYDDLFLVTVTGPNGTVTASITSVNTVGVSNSFLGTFPNLFGADETGNQSGSVDISGLGSPVTISFIVTDVGDTGFTTVVLVDDIDVGATGGDSEVASDECSDAAVTNDGSNLQIIQTVPPGSSTSVDPESTILVFFNDNIDVSSLGTESVSITGSPSVTYDCHLSESGNAILSITPAEGFPASTSITVTLPVGGVLDDEGNSLASQYSFSFTTAAASSSASGTGLDFEAGSLPTGVSCIGDCGVLGSFGDAPPVGTYGAYISTGSSLVSSGSAVDGTTSVLTISNVSPGVSTLTFTYNFISEEFDEYVGSSFDDLFLVTVTGPSGTVTKTITSVNIVGTANSFLGSFPGLSGADETGNQAGSVDISGLGSPVTIAFIVTDVGDAAYSTVVLIDDINLGQSGVSDDHGDTNGTATLVSPTSSTSGELEASGDTDVFRIDLPAGTHVVQTTGSTDTYGEIFDSSGTSLGTDDDSGTGSNFALQCIDCSARTIYVHVTGFAGTTTGAYTLVSEFTPSGALQGQGAREIKNVGSYEAP